MTVVTLLGSRPSGLSCVSALGLTLCLWLGSHCDGASADGRPSAHKGLGRRVSVPPPFAAQSWLPAQGRGSGGGGAWGLALRWGPGETCSAWGYSWAVSGPHEDQDLLR